MVNANHTLGCWHSLHWRTVPHSKDKDRWSMERGMCGRARAHLGLKTSHGDHGKWLHMPVCRYHMVRPHASGAVAGRTRRDRRVWCVNNDGQASNDRCSARRPRKELFGYLDKQSVIVVGQRTVKCSRVRMPARREGEVHGS